MEIKARETLRDLNVVTVRSVPPAGRVTLGGQRQSVAVAKAVMSNARLVIMDEPTAALGVAQTQHGARPDQNGSLARGVAVLVISHNLV